METPKASQGLPSLVVVGGGIAGISAAVEAAEAGCEVVLIEREPNLGGRVAQMHQYFPKLCPPLCGLEINLRRIRTNPRIVVHTLARVEDVTGDPGNYRIRVQQQPRFVSDRCSGCGACAEVCPVERPSRFDFGLKTTRAAYLAYPGAHPPRYAIDPTACLGIQSPPPPSPRRSRGESGGEGLRRLPQTPPPCLLACPCQAIDLAQQPRTFHLAAHALIWATGWQPYPASKLADLGFGSHPDIITNMMLERLASPHGPTSGRILCPSDGRAPASVAFVQCAGSRDDAHLGYCSGLCCMASLKHARYLRGQHPGCEIFLFYIDRRTTGRHESFLADSERDDKMHFVPGKVARVTVPAGRPVLEVEDTASASKRKQAAELVVLATGMVPSDIPAEDRAHLAADRYGFLTRAQPRAGQLPAGCARAPMDVASAVRDATGAVLRALAFCPAQG